MHTSSGLPCVGTLLRPHGGHASSELNEDEVPLLYGVRKPLSLKEDCNKKRNQNHN